MKDFLLYLVRNITDNPDTVSVEEANEQGALTLSLTVAKEDMGKIIGKEGRIIKSLRDLLKILAVKRGIRVNLLLKET